jgi:Rod binding domain-containing protein
VTPDLSITSDGRLPSATGDQTQRLKRVANQFETAFVQMIFKDMDNHVLDEEPLIGGGSASEQFNQLYRSGLSERAAGHLGIADMLVHELSARAGVKPAAGAAIPKVTP